MTEKLPQIIQHLLDEQNLTIYGLAQLIGAATDEPIKTIHRRISNLLERSPKSWQQIEQTLDVLGYQITISRKSEN